MPASIKLLPRKCFEIILEDGTIISGQHGTWSLKRFCDKLKLTLKEAQERLSNPGLTEIFEYLLCAVEYSARKESKPFSYTDVHVGSWIDELGGMQSDAFIDLFNHSASDIKGEDDPEKKTESLSGQNSKEPISALAVT